MNFQVGEFYHVYNRGNNRQRIFFQDKNYIFFLNKIREQLYPFSDIIAYCLMPNHFHFLLRANANGLMERNSFGGKPMQELAYRMGILLSSYSQAINKQNLITGSLFQQKTKAKILNETNNGSRLSYFEYCFHYIHQNPVNAGLVRDVLTWPYSSYQEYTGNHDETLCKKEIFFSLTGLSIRDIIVKTGEILEQRRLNKIF